MTNSDEMKIDVDGLGTHQKHLAALTDRIGTAREAARTPLSADAFGVFGGGLADECIQAQEEGADTLQVALDASDVHHEQVGAWANDVDTNELDLVAMFKAPEDD